MSGCASPRKLADWNDPARTIAGTQVSQDNFTKQTKFLGPEIGDGGFGYILIRAWKKASGDLSYQIYVKDVYFHE